MMSVIAALLAMRRWTLLDARRHLNARRRAAP
jgi:hypothetical protein